MTLPYERSRAVVQTQAFLLEVANGTRYKRVPREVKMMARHLLRHYPMKSDLQMTHNGWGSKLHEFMFECPFGDPDEPFA
jgi:pyruvate/oxaloacetate carboxyltransferase